MAVSITVIGNCQVDSFWLCLRALLPDAEVTPVRIAEARRKNACDAMAERAGASDIVLTQELTDPSFGRLCTAELAAMGPRLQLYPKVMFTGFHPDCTSVTDVTRPVKSPIGAYHSTLALSAYLAGLPVARTIELFRAETYAALGYFDEFAKSVAYLEATARPLGFDLTPELDRWMAGGVFMHSFNHPKLRVMASICRQAVGLLGLEAAEADLGAVEDPLARAQTWPLYPEIGRRLGLEEPFAFRASAEEGAAALSLSDYVSQSYLLYDQEPREVLARRGRRHILEIVAGLA